VNLIPIVQNFSRWYETKDRWNALCDLYISYQTVKCEQQKQNSLLQIYYCRLHWSVFLWISTQERRPKYICYQTSVMNILKCNAAMLHQIKCELFILAVPKRNRKITLNLSKLLNCLEITQGSPRKVPIGKNRLQWKTAHVRLRLKCDGTCAETGFRLSAKRTGPFNP
jgi:hypothetical protein